jgi:hypothetical protein
MRDHQQLALLQLAPGASVSIAQFDEINWAVIFGAPPSWLDLRDALIHLDE